jgi:hypothetical protein
MAEEIQILIDGATNVIDLKKLRNKLKPKGDPDEYPTDADVMLIALRKADETAITGTENLPMAHVEGTSGKKTTYRAMLAEDVDLTVGETCVAEILAIVAGGVRPFFKECKVMRG